MIKIIAITQDSPYLKHVQLLADQNTSTLGFLPYEAFRDHASRRWILGAIEEDSNSLAGYLIYRVVKKIQSAQIVHLCINSEYRGKGVSESLFSELKERTKALNGIRLLCRRDYENANRLWARLGLSPIHEKPGRGQSHSTVLTLWWYRHQQTLFEMSPIKKHKVAIDANIFLSYRILILKTHKLLQLKMIGWEIK